MINPLMCDGAPTMYIFYSTDIPSYIYYIFLPSIIVTLLLGFFVFLRNKREFSAHIFLALTLVMSIWMISMLGNWAQNDSRLSIFFDEMNILVGTIPAIFLYFILSIFYNKDKLNLWKIALIFIPVLPLLILMPSAENVQSIDLGWCETMAYGKLYWYLAFILISYAIVISSFLISRIWKSESNKRNQIILILIGFIIWFFVSAAMGVLLPLFGYVTSTLWAPISCTMFTFFISWSMVKYGFFNMRNITAQVLVATLVILVGSQFFFIQNNINRILTGISLVLSVIFGYILIRSVKREIEQREALAVANKEISERKEQLQKISDHLSIANSKLKELDNMKSEFISIVAHQLQGPPTTVKGYSMLLTDGSYGELNADQKDILQKIFNANEQQVAFVDDLLSVSRLESGRVVFNFEKSKIEDICQEVIDNLFLKAKDKSLYLEYIKPTGVILPELNIDRAKIKEAVLNLVDNAIKYTKRGGVRVTLKICEEFGEKCLDAKHIRIMVSDTGIGVPADEIPRLFSKFSRGKDVKRLNASGTGLGLYVVKMVVEGNRGKVWIESDGDGKGSKFIIELPIA